MPNLPLELIFNIISKDSPLLHQRLPGNLSRKLVYYAEATSDRPQYQGSSDNHDDIDVLAPNPLPPASSNFRLHLPTALYLSPLPPAFGKTIDPQPAAIWLRELFRLIHPTQRRLVNDLSPPPLRSLQPPAGRRPPGRARGPAGGPSGGCPRGSRSSSACQGPSCTYLGRARARVARRGGDGAGGMDVMAGGWGGWHCARCRPTRGSGGRRPGGWACWSRWCAPGRSVWMIRA